ncbi:right-handed parallel beta-helix repeat-containing protein [Isoptericola sp. AK164]|uniref:pectate lyase family protein n=1 Tax=Isoptericola sp. AK164 TaxID=3024246 RepID=UPI0024181D88|nr:right-handed parallel beta-helix repeat-containing protein [Isoptericola sp. AK164]
MRSAAGRRFTAAGAGLALAATMGMTALWASDAHAATGTPTGFATQNGGTTGGAGGQTVRATTGTEIHEALCTRASSDTPIIIEVEGIVDHGNTSKVSGDSCNTADDKIELKEISNVTLVGVGDGALFDELGIHLRSAHNIVIQDVHVRNVKKSGSPTSNGGDAIGMESGVSNVWVDHVTLEASGGESEGYDALFDMKADTTYVTLSYSVLRNSGRGGLVGSSDGDTGNGPVTYHHNLYENIDSRTPLLRAGTAHSYNNHFVGLAKSGINSRLGARALVENNYFQDSKDPLGTFYTDDRGTWEVSGNIWDNITWTADDTDNHPAGPNPTSTDSISVPYSYDLDGAECVPNLLAATAGANTGMQVSDGSCSPTAPDPTPEPTDEPTQEPTPEPTEDPTPEPTDEPTDPPSGENLSIGAGSDGSSKASGTSYGNVRDGDLATYWSPEGSTGRISVKWDSATTVSSIVVREAAGSAGNIGSWQVQNHDTGQVLATGSGAGVIDIPTTSLSKIDFEITSSSGTPRVAELETYAGSPSDPDRTPEPTEEPTPEPTQDPTPEPTDEPQPGADTLYVAPSGSGGAAGTVSDPTTLAAAIDRVNAGGEIFLAGGTYDLADTVTIEPGHDGLPGDRTLLSALPGETPVLDFSAQVEDSANRGLAIGGDYWHVYGLVVQHAGDNGILLGGDHNVIERVVTRYNHDTGLQISRFVAGAPRDQWPSDNLVVSSESHDNADSDGEDADGFAAKLTSGPGNVFRDTVAHHNIDDGWDLYTKSATGPIGEVTIESSLAYSNGTLSDGSQAGAGDRNGFKLGGEDIAVDHVVRDSYAVENGKHGFTYNRNLGTMAVEGNVAVGNEQRNFNFDGGSSVFSGNVSCDSGSTDRYLGTDAGGNSFWDGSDGSACSAYDGAMDWSFAADGSLQVTFGGSMPGPEPTEDPTPEPTDEPTDPPSGENLSIGAGSDGSSKASGTSYGNVRDGDLATYWSPEGSTGRISVKWDSATTVSSIVVRETAGTVGTIGSWQVVNHDDGQVLATGSGAGAIDIPTTTLDKIDFEITSSSGTPQVAELETYGG